MVGPSCLNLKLRIPEGLKSKLLHMYFLDYPILVVSQDLHSNASFFHDCAVAFWVACHLVAGPLPELEAFD